jgi:molybdenum cofactor cytidylyltransferase
VTKTAGAILLAAGRATRFGSDKRQIVATWRQGERPEPLLHHVIGLYRACFTELGVVIAPGDPFGQAACGNHSATVLINERADLGMGGSLAVGIAWLIDRGVDCAVVGLADMPWVSEEMIRKVTMRGLRTRRLVAPRWHGQWGFPRAIPSVHFAELAAMSGERGASALLDWDGAMAIDCLEPGVVQDIDRPADLTANRTL